MSRQEAWRFRKRRRAECNQCERADEQTAVDPWNSILSLSQENCDTHSQVSHRQQEIRREIRRCELLAAAALLRRSRALSVCRRSVRFPSRYPSLDGRLPRRRPVCLFGRWFSSPASLLGRLRRLLFFLFFLRHFLDSRKLPQNLFSFLRCLATSCHLNREHL